MYLIFDTETTGLPKNYNAPITDADNWPRLVQLAWQLHDAEGKLLEARILSPAAVREGMKETIRTMMGYYA